MHTHLARGYFAANKGMHECQYCHFTMGVRYTSTEGASSCEVCEPDYYMHPVDGCLPCLGVVAGADSEVFPGVLCPTAGSALAHLTMQKGHYRFEPTSGVGYYCTWPNNCIGGNKTGAGLCRNGAGGPLW